MVRSLLNSVPGAASRSRIKPEANHLFVNNVRFWSMLAIIAAHSLIVWPLHGEWTAAQNCLNVWAGTFLVYYGVSLIMTQAFAARRTLSWMVGQWTAEKISEGPVCSRREWQTQLEGEVSLVS